MNCDLFWMCFDLIRHNGLQSVTENLEKEERERVLSLCVCALFFSPIILLLIINIYFLVGTIKWRKK